MNPLRRARRSVLAGCVLFVAAVPLTAAAGDARQGRRAAVISGLPLVEVPGGRYDPVYAIDSSGGQLEVEPFLLMTRPVTNADFLAFIGAHPRYRRDRIARIFADEHYLSHWVAPARLGPGVRPRQPVTRVSWFAAKAFCESRGLRLPTEAEWELAAAASPTRRDGRAESAFNERLLEWYARPNGVLPDVPHGRPNWYGASDLHGVIWEWVLDFNNAVAVEDSRNQGDAARDRFCGGSALLAANRTDYASFMRIAMRSSLQAHYTTANLGFRCAADRDAVGKQP